jgi:uncharacterized protein
MNQQSKHKTTAELRQILATVKTIAVVGLSDKPERPSYGVAAYLQGQGYRIIPVNPNLREVLGEKAYPSLQDIPTPVDVVDVFRRSEYVPAIVDNAIAIGAKVIWLQLGVIHEEAAARAEAAGLTAVRDNCMGATHRYLRAMNQI